MRKLFKNLTAIGLSVTMVVGTGKYNRSSDVSQWLD